MAAPLVVRETAGVADEERVCALFRRIWSEDPANAALTPVVLHALAHAGSYAALAESDGELLGACVGFFGVVGGGWELHSHIAGVTAEARGRSVGFALKTHQREWALERGVERVTWTFDPLVRRNAYFNLTKLGARPRAYLIDFYGPMADAINAGDASDRLDIEWRLRDDQVARACAGHPKEPDADELLADGAVVGLSADDTEAPVPGDADAGTVLVGVPADIERMRGTDRSRAVAWRHAVRDVLGGLMSDGAGVTGFARPGWYVVQRGDS